MQEGIGNVPRFALILSTLLVGIAVVDKVQKKKDENVPRVIGQAVPSDTKKVMEPPKVVKKQLTYEEALRQSKQEQKKILVFLDARWCDACKKMESETLNDPRIKSRLSDFIFLHLNLGSSDGEYLGKYWKVKTVPYYAILDSQIVFNRGDGFKNTDMFMQWIDSANQSKTGGSRERKPQSRIEPVEPQWYYPRASQFIPDSSMYFQQPQFQPMMQPMQFFNSPGMAIRGCTNCG